MGIAELFFILIFVLILLINVIAGILRKKTAEKSRNDVTKTIYDERIREELKTLQSGVRQKETQTSKLKRKWMEMQTSRLNQIKPQKEYMAPTHEERHGIKTKRPVMPKGFQRSKSSVRQKEIKEQKVVSISPKDTQMKGKQKNTLKKIDELPILKKAVIFSEIISPPKALRE